MTLPSRPTIRLSSPGDMAIAIPMLLGYHPDESLVVSCLEGSAVALTMRFDLADLPTTDRFATELADRVQRAAADVTFVAVFTAETPYGGSLPHADLVEQLYADPRLRVVEAVLVSDRRWWSYLCPDPACCPPAGRPLDATSEVATSLSAAFALTGSGVLADRQALVDAVSLDSELDARAASRRVRQASREVQSMTAGRRTAEARTLVDTLVERLEDPRAAVSDSEIALLAGLLHDVGARDDVLIQAVPPGRRSAILWLLRDAVRRVPPPYDAPLCTALAWFAYADGDGTTANIALDRALQTDPEYSLALLIAASLDRQLPPEALVEVMRGAARDLDARDAAG
ncbi:MAG TPA: DUF4192 domain-containing protein [Mycobacteriales bacterium]|nr:DUF4192 domain-containing protein [Mycobacteriales bacterium]